MPRSFFVSKKAFTARSFRFLAPTLPVAAVFALLGGCGSGSGTAPSNDILPNGLVPSAFPLPTPFPTVFPFPTPLPTASATPTPTPSATAPAQTVTGTLRIEESTGNGVVAAPFTPTSGSATFPIGFNANFSPARFTFETNEPFTDATGAALTNRRVVVSLILNDRAKSGQPVTLSLTNNKIEYRETKNAGGSNGIVTTYQNRASLPGEGSTAASTITLVSVVGDVYTFAVDALLSPSVASSDNAFRLRGTVTIYAPNTSSYTGN